MLRPPKPGSYRLSGDARGFLETTLPEPLILHDDAWEEVLVRLDPGATITGRVVGLEAAWLGRVEVSGYTESQSLRGRGVASDGSFRLSGAQAGTWSVWARLEEPIRAVRRVISVEPGQSTANVELDFEAGNSLTVRILYNGEPSSHASVSLWEEDAKAVEPYSLYQRTDHEGVAHFANLDPGRYRVTATQEDDVTKTLEIDLVTDEEVEIHLPSTSREETPE